MAIERIFGGGSWVPGLPQFSSATPQYVVGGRVIDASGEKMAFIISAPRSGTIDTLEFRCAAVTQDPGSNGIKLSFQGIDATTGNPNESITHFRVITTGFSSGAWVIPGLITSDGTDTGTKKTVVRGELFAFVYEFESWQGGSDFTLGALDTDTGHVPYFCHKTGGSWVKEVFSPTLGLKYEDGGYPYVSGFGFPCASLATATINNGTTPDEIGMTFAFPSDVLIGQVALRVDLDGDADVILYDSEGVAQRTVSLDKDVRSSTGMSYLVPQFADFRCLANQEYTVAIKPTTSTSIIVAYYTVNSASMLTEMEGGASWHWRERTDGGEWTDTLDRKPWFHVLITGLDHEVGGQPSTGFEGLT